MRTRGLPHAQWLGRGLGEAGGPPQLELTPPEAQPGPAGAGLCLRFGRCLISMQCFTTLFSTLC